MDSEKDSLSRKLLHAAGQKTPLWNIARIVSKEIGNPVIIFDAGYKVLAYIQQEDHDAKNYWNMYIKAGLMNIIGVEAAKQNDWVKLYRSQKTEIFYAKDYVTKQPIVVMCRGVCINGKWVATIVSVDYNGPFRDNVSEALEVAAEATAVALLRIDQTVIEDSSLEIFLKNLLVSDLKKNEIKAVYQKLDPNSNTAKKVLVLKRKKCEKKTAGFSMQYYAERTRNLRFVKACFIERNSLIALIDISKCQKTQTEEWIMQEFGREELVGGFSKMFTEILDFPSSVHQAKYALNRAELADCGYISFDTVLLDYLLDHVKKEMNLEECIDYRVIKLKKYDSNNNTELYKTCVYYLNHMLNAAESAKALNIHYNTMKNRIMLMKDMGIDFHDSNDILQISLSIRIMERLTI